MNNRVKNISRVAVFAMLVVIVLSLAACQKDTSKEAGITPVVLATATAEATPIPPTPAPLVLAGATTTASGLQYLELTPGTGDAPQFGYLISMHYIASLPDGTELANTYTENKPATAVWGKKYLLPGWEEGIGLMKVGGKAKFVIPPDLAFGEAGTGSIPPNSQIVIEMELLTAAPTPMPLAVTESNLKKTASGLLYYDTQVGTGAEAVTESNVTTAFTLWVKTDSGFDYVASSEGGSPVNFIVGRRDVVFPGWDEGATGMKVGGKRHLVVSPELGLGEQAAGNIPANATLVLEIELMTVTEPRVATVVDEKDYVTTASGLKYYDLVVSAGETPAAGQTVVVHYTGWLVDGTQFDSSVDRGEPFSFQLGAGGVIAGWEEGVATMKVGGKRQLVVPAALGYGDQGAGSTIPPGATLVFEVELLEIQK